MHFSIGLRATCVILVAAFGSTSGCCLRNCGHASNQPSISIYDLDGSSFDLLGQRPHATKVAIFMRSDCPIANRYAPEIRRLAEKYRPADVEFYLVFVDPRESSGAIRKHLQEYGYQCPGLRDPQHSLVKHCNATTTPEAVVFDRDRKIAYLGRIDDLYLDVGQPRNEATTHELADAIDATIAGRPIAVPRTQAIGCLIADLKE